MILWIFFVDVNENNAGRKKKWSLVDNLIHENWRKNLFVLNVETIRLFLKYKN